MPSVSMAFVNQIPNPLTGWQLDEPLLCELNHATNGVAAVLANVPDFGQAGQSGRKHFIDRFKIAIG